MLYCLFLFFAIPSFASRNTDTDQKIIYAGLLASQNELKIDDKAGKEEALLEGPGQGGVTAGLMTKPKPLFSRLPWLRGTVDISFASFKTNSQIVTINGKKKNDGVELDTASSGYLAYINPALVLYYGFSDNFYTYLGVGIGGGYTSISGDYYQTGGTVSASCSSSQSIATIQSNCEKKSFGTSRFTISQSVTAVMSLGWFGIKFDIGGSTYKDGGRTYNPNIKNASFYLQYRF